LSLDSNSGKEQWRRDLKGADFVNVVLVQDRVLATTKGEIFCLDRSNGIVLWHNPLTGLGRGLITIATEGTGGQTVPVAEKRKRDEEAAAAAASVAVVAAGS
jgi:outer membrane protein assembly factor BamB